MSIFLNSIKIAVKQPLGCIVSLIFSSILVGGMLLVILFATYALLAVGLVKNSVQNATGFYPSADSIFVNVYTGKCTINNLRIDNPSIYGAREYFEKSSDRAKSFLTASKVVMNIDALALLRGEIVVSSLDLHITSLNCVRLNNSTYNMAEFLLNMKKVFSIAKEDGEPVLKNFNLVLANITYRDLSSLSDVIKFNASPDFKFAKNNVSDFGKMFSELISNLDENKMSFLSRAFLILQSVNK